MYISKSHFISSGSALPAKCVTNDDMAKIVDTNDEWIRTRTGITQRFFAAEGELTSDLAAAAANQALERAGIPAHKVDLVIVATATPDETFPATATKVQHAVGAGGVAYDVNAACAGYLLAMELADQALTLGRAQYALVIGAETFSRILDFEDRRTCVLFGDGAGAVLMGRRETGKGGVLSCCLHSDGAQHDILRTSGGVSLNKEAGTVLMSGQEVFRHAVEKLNSAATQALQMANKTAEDVTWFVPHQANQRILSSTMKKMKLSEDKLISTVGLHANTSAASIPLAIDHGIQEGKIRSGDLLLHQAIGAGLVWGAGLVRWD